MLGANASGAKVKAFWLAIDGDGSRVDIGQPAAVGVSLGMANVVTKLGRLPA